MILSIIVAVDKDGGIGIGNRLPWHISTDLKRFKSLTMGHHLVAGRKTFESIGRALPGRTMIVVTRNRDYSAEECLIAHTLSQALTLAESRGEDEAFIIGGGEIFVQSIDIVDRLYITYVHTSVHADVFFPKIDLSEWEEISVSEHDTSETDEHPSTYKKLIRKKRE